MAAMTRLAYISDHRANGNGPFVGRISHANRQYDNGHLAQPLQLIVFQ